MLTEIVLSPEGKKPQEITFEELFNYTGKKKLKNVKSFKAKADTSDMSLSYLGDFLPALQILRLDYSTVGSLRDLSTPLPNLRVLSLTHCNLSSIDGISTISSSIQELYLSFNLIDDISPLIGFNSLKILDLESNLIVSVEDASLLKCCKALRDLTLRGTGAAEDPEYRTLIKSLLPKLQILDGIKYGEENKEEEKPPEVPPPPPPTEQLPPINQPPPSQTTEKPDERRAKLPPLGKNNRKMSPKKVRQPRPPKIWHNIGPIKL